MSTEFDGEGGTKLEAELGPLEDAGTVQRTGLALAVLWKPLAVEPSGLWRSGNGTASANPYEDGRIYFSVIEGGFVHGGQGSGSGAPGEFYTDSDGWRIDAWTMHDGGTTGIVRRHTYYYDGTGNWTHVQLSSQSFFRGTTSFSGGARFGSFNDSEAGAQRIAAVAVWATGGSLSDAAVAGLTSGLHAWAALSPTALWSLQDATELTIDPLGLGIEATGSAGISYSEDEPPGWSYELSAPAQVLSVRYGDELVNTDLSGVVRLGGQAIPFGPDS